MRYLYAFLCAIGYVLIGGALAAWSEYRHRGQITMDGSSLLIILWPIAIGIGLVVAIYQSIVSAIKDA